MVVGEFSQEADVVVIGGGPGGYSAAFRAAELGQSVVIVDPREQLGGVCLHDGCVPSKTLSTIGETLASAARARSYGITFGDPTIDLDAVRAWMTKSIETLANGLAGRARTLGVEHVRGHAQFEDSRQISIRASTVPRIRFRRAVIATGSKPLQHGRLPFDVPQVLTPPEAVHLPEIPHSLLIVGSSYSALELAQIYTALGSRVTLVTERDALLPDADADLMRPVIAALRKQLHHIGLGTTVTGIEQGGIAGAGIGAGVRVGFEGRQPPKLNVFDRVIVALGFRCNIDDLDLGRTRVELDAAGFVKVDEQMRTADPRILAVGDVTGHPQLADIALQQGRVAGEVLAGWNSALDVRAVPHAVFTDPQVAWCGLTEAEARAKGIEVGVSKVRWDASGRAVGMGRADGVSKLVYDRHTSIILGIGHCGSEACELIGGGALAVEMGAELDDLAGTVHPHPTLNELIADAARRAARADSSGSP